MLGKSENGCRHKHDHGGDAPALEASCLPTVHSRRTGPVAPSKQVDAIREERDEDEDDLPYSAYMRESIVSEPHERSLPGTGHDVRGPRRAHDVDKAERAS